MPDGPIPSVREGRQFPAGIDGVGVADGTEEMAVQQAVSVGVAKAQIELLLFGKHFDRLRFLLAVDDFAGEVAAPPPTRFCERSCTDTHRELDAASFQFAFERGCGQERQHLQSPADQDNFMALARMPDHTSNSFLEEGNGSHMTKHQVAIYASQVAFVVVLYGHKAFWQQP